MKVHYRQSMGLTPRIVIDRVSGDITIKGWMRSEVYVASEADSISIQEQAGQIHLSSPADCILRVPRAAQVEIDQALGNVQLKYLNGAITINTIAESLAARSLARLTIQSVDGDVLLKGILDEVTISKINGDLILRDLQGEGNFTEVNGSFDARAINGSIIAKINDDARLEVESLLAKGIQLQVAGDLRCELVKTLDALINMSSAEEDILIRGEDGQRRVSERSFQYKLGAGNIPLNFVCGGKIILITHPPAWRSSQDFQDMFGGETDRVADQFEADFKERMESQVLNFNQQMQKLTEEIEKLGVSQPMLEKILESARASSQKASLRAQEKMRQAQEKLEQRMAEAKRKSAAKMDGQEGVFAAGDDKARGGAPPGMRKGGLEEERLFILKMLEEKKITVEQAENLLAALGEEG